jgi:hypothetical protein
LKSLHDFQRKLELLEWNPAGYIDPEVLRLLAEVGREPRLVRDVVNSWTAKSLQKRQLSCHETSTHYKWFVFYHNQLRYRIWLHQYKLPSERGVGHAEIPHNHRYSLASVILRGGFVHHFFERTEGKLIELAQESRSYSRGDAYMLDWQRLHKLSALTDHTITLVVESPVVRNFSEAFYSESGQPNLFYDFVGLHSRLSAEMTHM